MFGVGCVLLFLLCGLSVKGSPFIPTPTPAIPVSPTPSPTPINNRPQLKSSSLIQSDTVVGNEVYEYTQMALEFDQPLYLNEALLCAEAEYPCFPNDCVACDWTGSVDVRHLDLLIFARFSQHSPFFSHPCAPPTAVDLLSLGTMIVIGVTPTSSHGRLSL